ncbi:MAG: DUF4136 domain-containing protein [Xanthomonadales bacterium]|nr:DUF4136 domain-containing protein [Xanthomonadales bacterium]
MSKFSKITMMLISVMLITSCASGPTIQSDYDHSVDFSKYKTYGYFNPMGIENPNYSSLLGQMFRDAIDAQMKPRGYVLSDNPDLLINVSARFEDKTKVTTYNDPKYGGYYGYRGGRYATWGGYGYGTSTHVSQYTEGTVNIDMVDSNQKRMVWEGIAIGRVDGKKKNENLRQDIMDGVAEMFTNYPFRAGQ